MRMSLKLNFLNLIFSFQIFHKISQVQSFFVL
jgi:hypothetical protein